MLGTDLAALYGVEPRALVQSVKRDIARFPADFMFQLTAEEHAVLKSQIVISSWGGPRRARPYAFTEQGVAMLSSILRSERAVAVNIQIMRAIRALMAGPKKQKKPIGFGVKEKAPVYGFRGKSNHKSPARGLKRSRKSTGAFPRSQRTAWGKPKWSSGGSHESSL